MPVELSPFEVRRALALLDKRSKRAADDAEAAVQALTWRASDEPAVFTQHRLQYFLWYELPRKWLAPEKDLIGIAQALGGFFEAAGETTARYAAICRSAVTVEMIRAEGKGCFELIEASGVESPDTPLLRWSDLMTPEEARIRDATAEFLEEAIVRGELVPGAEGWRERQVELTDSFLSMPGEMSGETPLAAVHSARIDSWLGHPTDTDRRSLLQTVVPLIGGREPAAAEAADALEPLLWLLGRLEEGVPLTQTGAFGRAFVREAVVRYPRWWRSELFGPPNREAEVYPLEMLHDLVRRLRLARRRGRAYRATGRARALQSDPRTLLALVVRELGPDDEIAPGGFDVAAALLLADPAPGNEELERRLRRLVELHSLLTDRERLSDLLPHILVGEVHRTLAPFNGSTGSYPEAPRLTPAGRTIAVAVLRARATAPRHML